MPDFKTEQSLGWGGGVGKVGGAGLGNLGVIIIPIFIIIIFFFGVVIIGGLI